MSHAADEAVKPASRSGPSTIDDHIMRPPKSLRVAFSRFHAARQLQLDAACSVVGALMYLSMLKSLWAAREHRVAAAVVALAAHTLWPNVMLRTGVGLQWRDQLFFLHFLLHHAAAPLLLFSHVQLRLGGAGGFLGSAALFLAASLARSSVPWHAVNGLMYRMQARRFLALQPLVVAAALPVERLACAAHVAESPALAAAAYGRAAGALRAAAGLVLPPAPAAARAPGAAAAALADCVHVHAWCMVAFGYLLPLAVIWRLERHAWAAFAAALARRPPGAASAAADERALAAAARAAGAPGPGAASALDPVLTWRGRAAWVLAAAAAWRGAEMLAA